MKKLIVLVLGLLLSVSLFATINISTTNVKVNGTYYSCKGTNNTLFEGLDLGNMSSLSLNGSLKNSGTSGVSEAYMRYRFTGADWSGITLDNKQTISQSPDEKLSLNPGDEETVHPNSLMKTLGDTDTFTRSSNLSVDLSGLTNGVTYNFDVYFRISGTYDPSDAPTSDYTATFTKIANIGFIDGSSFTPDAPTKGNTEQVIGRFYLDADVSGATLTDASIKFDGTRTGFSNFKIWSSTDDTFGSDTKLGNTIVADPGVNPADFTSLSSTIPTSGFYYFVTADIDAEATGAIQGFVADNSDLTITSGEIGETIADAALSTAEAPTFICLTSFIANVNKGKVELTWTTASETENSHFLIYRDNLLIAKVAGSGTCSNSHTYTYSDSYVICGKVVEYKLSDVSFGGIVTEHTPVNIEIGENVLPGDFFLKPAYPNPFNPRTVISMHYAVGSNSVVNIFNTQGVLVDQLINGFVEAGHHELTWDASGLPSGVYLVTMQAGNTVQSQKIVLMK